MAGEGSESAKQTGLTLFLTGFGGYDKMQVVATDKPERPERNQLLINVRACGINFAELMMRQGSYDRLPKLPAVPGFEASGSVLMVGEDVTGFKVGDRVACAGSSGLWSEFVCVSPDQCLIIPDNMTYEEAAAIPVNYLTAYHMLFNFGHLSRGQSVLIHMAAGGVGIAATQLCRTVPDVTIFGTASAAKHETLRKQGVNHPIDYRTQDYVQEIRKISPEGVDLVLDPLNGADARKGFDLLKPFGKIVHFGAANAVVGQQKSYWNLLKTYFTSKSYNSVDILSANRAVCGYHLGHLIDHLELVRPSLKAIVDLYHQGKIKPQIDSVWSFADIGKAMERMHERKNVGKVIICPHKAADGETTEAK